MPKQKRYKTKYPGVYYIQAYRKDKPDAFEKIFYIQFYKVFSFVKLKIKKKYSNFIIGFLKIINLVLSDRYHDD